MNTFRSLLFIPGNSPKMLGKASGLPADTIVPDLEDSVPPEEKANARAILSEHLPGLAAGGRPVFVRCNGMTTGMTWDDLKAVVSKHIVGISIGKMESREMALELSALLSVLERERGLPEGHTKVIPWIETGKGLANVREIAASTPRMLGIAFGAEDYSADMGIARTKEGAEIATARVLTAIAARAADITPFDTPNVDFNDMENLNQDCLTAKSLGFKGKFAIHPKQIETINAVFRPSAAEVDWASRVVRAFEEGKRRGTAAVAVDGKMVDTPIWKNAVKILDLHQAIERAEKVHR
ncbi:MAG: CoA ester lyase [Chloroflexi bacterium]|nr:CoA ester lyase [Chloroflexota bacterium]